jgi:hypothetical protein
MIRNLLIYFLLLLVGLTSCSEPPPLRLTSRQRERVDSLYVDSVKVLNREMDSLCDVRFETELSEMVDSLIQLRLDEEALLRQKYQRK